MYTVVHIDFKGRECWSYVAYSTERLTPRFRMWLEYNGKPIVGKGGAAILEAIEEYGSISRAARAIGASYRFVLGYIKKVEKRLGRPIVEAKKGGYGGGGGAILTEDGKMLLIQYRRFESLVASALESKDKFKKELAKNDDLKLGGLWKLRLSMLGTLSLVIAATTLFVMIVLGAVGTFDLVALLLIVCLIHVTQWLFAPYLIESMLCIHEVSKREEPALHSMVEKLCAKSKLKKPRIMVAGMDIPNAFAYGSPLTGNKVAVTRGLLATCTSGEVEAVLGHEIGHLKHRDVQLMMALSILPAICFWIAYSFMFAGMYGRGRGGVAALIGLLAMVFYYILLLLNLHLSRLREYYADRHSATVVEGGAGKLSSALIKIVSRSSRIPSSERQRVDAFRMLFIEDPERAELDQAEIRAGTEIARELIGRKVTFWDRVAEIFSTHPNIIRRLKALQELT